MLTVSAALSGVDLIVTAAGARIAVAWRELDLELIELVPLLFCPLVVGDRQQFLKPAAGWDWLLRRVHPPLSHSSEFVGHLPGDPSKPRGLNLLGLGGTRVINEPHVRPMMRRDVACDVTCD